MESERPLVRVPLEILRSILRRTRHLVEKELSDIVAEIEDGSSRPAVELVGQISRLRARIKLLKNEYDAVVLNMEQRAEFMANYATATTRDASQSVDMSSGEDTINSGEHDLDDFSSSKKHNVSLHMQLLIVRWYLQRGYTDVASLLSNSQIDPLVDWKAFKERNLIRESLARRDLEPCLAWCTTNQASLRRRAIPIEYLAKSLRVRQLADDGKRVEAVMYARKHLAPLKNVHFHSIDLLRAGAYIVSPGTEDSTDDWIRLQALFLCTFDELMGVGASTLQLPDYVFTGISSVQIDKCAEGDCIGCPGCTSIFRPLQSLLPFAHHSRSVLDSDCVVLPNDNIIGLSKLEHRGDNIIDPVTREEFSTWEKVFPL